VLIISGIPMYLIFIYWKDKPLWLIRTSGKLSISGTFSTASTLLKFLCLSPPTPRPPQEHTNIF
jgi:hypothetical protein